MCHFDKLAHKKCAKFRDKKNDTLYCELIHVTALFLVVQAAGSLADMLNQRRQLYRKAYYDETVRMIEYK